MPRILVATPIKGSPTLAFHQGLMDVLLNCTDADYVPSVASATYVQTGRLAMVDEARRIGADEILWVDADMGLTAKHVLRLRSHDVDIVGGVYCKRTPGAPDWTLHATGEPQLGDLLPVNDIGFGLLRMKMRVFDKLDAYLGSRRRFKGERSEYFSVGRAVGNGWESPEEASLNSVQRLLEAFTASPVCTHAPTDILASIAEELAKKHASVDVIGEDVFFCRLCKAAGIPVFADTRCLLRHWGEVGFPVEEIAL